MSDAVEVELAGLMGSCTDLEGEKAQFTEVINAAQAVTMLTPMAFGILCGFFSVPANLLQTGAQVAIAALGQAIDGTAQDVRACHTEYIQVDREAAQRYKQLGTSDAGASWHGLPGSVNV